MMLIRNNSESGLGLIDTLIGMLIAAIASIGIFYLLVGLYRNALTIDNVSNRANDASQIALLASHFLTQANYQSGNPTALTLSSPTIQQGQYAPNDGVTIQWVPAGSSSVCTGTLVDKTEYVQNGNGAEPIQGIAWVETGNSPCHDGTAFFPTNNQWGFTGTQGVVGGVSTTSGVSPTIPNLSGCPGQQQGIVLSNTYAFRIGTNNIYGHGGTAQQVVVCMPNVAQ